MELYFVHKGKWYKISNLPAWFFVEHFHVRVFFSTSFSFFFILRTVILCYGILEINQSIISDLQMDILGC